MSNAHKHEADEFIERQTIAQPDRRFTAGLPTTTPLTLQVRRLSDTATLPTRAHATDSGYDLCAAEDVLLAPGETAIVPTGIAMALPPGYDAQIRPRSGVTAKTKLRVQLGTIDESYRKEIGIIVDNIAVNKAHRGYVGVDRSYPLLHTDGTTSNLEVFNSDSTYVIRKGDRLAQLVVSKRADLTLVEADGDLSETGRGGFGSTGGALNERS